MVISKRVINFIPVFRLWWFMLCVCNMGAPPSLNLLSEILRIVAIFNSRFLFSALLSVIAGLAVAYTLILYARSQQGQYRFSKTNIISLSLRETSLIFSHVFAALALSLVINLIF